MSSKSSYSLSIIAVSIITTLALPVLADTPDDMEHLSIFGSKNEVNDVPGSAHLISKEELEKFDYSDIMRTLTSVPGVYVLEEDGYGLRPNIGMRGTGQNRSEKVTIMEDGVLAAPAPYASPAAYYFPTAGRMEQVEVLKGTSSAMYGPRTTGGVVNMLSRQIPEAALAGQVKLQAGEDGYGKLHAYVGGSGERVSSVFEVYRYQADGFKNINHSDLETGFVKNDILAKVKVVSEADAKFYQEFEVKVKYSDEDSDETYMGVTNADYKTNPYTRYSASQLDNMATEHKQLQLNHTIDLSDRLTLSTSAYYNDFHRNWYKTNKVGTYLRDDENQYILDDQGQKEVGSESLAKGTVIAADFDAGLLEDPIFTQVKANNRDYLSQGIQSTLAIDLNDHQVKVGARYHEDEMDRFQWVDNYTIDQNYNITQISAGVPGSDSNRIDSAKAIALFIHDEFSVGDFIINAGLRYEDMTLERHDWGKSDSARDNTPSHKENDVDVLLPSLAVTYKLSDDLLLVGGVQKGFAPPAPGNQQAENEESINYEFGTRYTKNTLHAEALVFFSDYENMHGNCTASQSCDDDNIGNQYNGGEVEVKGLELKIGNEFTVANYTVPVDLTYTYTATKFLNSFESALDTWGDVEAGDELPYVPENQLQFSAGLVGEKWRGDIVVRYMDKMRTSAGQSTYSEAGIDSRTVIDMAAHYDIAKNQTVSLNVDNLLDEEYVSTKTHGSIMVGKPRSLTIGYSYSF